MRTKLALAPLLVACLMAGAAVAQPAPAAPSPERLKLAREVFEARGGEETVRLSMDRMVSSMQRALPSNGRTSDVARQAAQDVIKDMLPQLVEIEIEVYAETYDDKQLRDILAFYESPTGQALKAKSPEVAERIGAETGRLVPQITANIAAKVCAQVACTEAQQKAVEALKARQAGAAKP